MESKLKMKECHVTFSDCSGLLYFFLISFHCSVCLSELLCDSLIMMDHDTQWLYQLLASVQLERFYLRMRDGLNVTRIEHLNYVKEADLEQIGISKPGLSCKAVYYVKIIIT